jgi:UDP-N-acetylglucosamine enolpyruvyl transferase
MRLYLGTTRSLEVAMDVQIVRPGCAIALSGRLGAATVADGVTTVADVHHVDRGYERFVESLQAIGAHVVRRSDDVLV